MGDSQRFALENSPQIAKVVAIHQNFRRYCKKAILYPICSEHPMLSISMAYNVISCKKSKETLKKSKVLFLPTWEKALAMGIVLQLFSLFLWFLQFFQKQSLCRLCRVLFVPS